MPVSCPGCPGCPVLSCPSIQPSHPSVCRRVGARLPLLWGGCLIRPPAVPSGVSPDAVGAAFRSWAALLRIEAGCVGFAVRRPPIVPVFVLHAVPSQTSYGVTRQDKTHLIHPSHPFISSVHLIHPSHPSTQSIHPHHPSNLSDASNVEDGHQMGLDEAVWANFRCNMNSKISPIDLDGSRGHTADRQTGKSTNNV